jgi:hypothetical protein
MVDTPFTALVADCEGCIEHFLNENTEILKTVRIILLEEDMPDKCNYPAVKKLLKEEIKLGIDNFKIFEDFRNRIEKIKTNVKKNMENLSNKYKNIYGFGAPAKATTSLNYFGIEKYFNGVFEDNELKYNKYIPGTNLKILKKNNKLSIDCLIVFAWNFFNDIKKNNITLSENIISIKEIEN